MESLDKSFIVVSGYKETHYPILEHTYYEISRKDIVEIEGLKSRLDTWSEYSPFWKAFPIKDEIETVGLMQYRAFLALDPAMSYDYEFEYPFEYRNKIAVKQLKHLDDYKNQLVVANKVSFEKEGLSAWEQYDKFHGNSTEALQIASDYFKMTTGIDAESQLKNQDYIHPRNIFLGPRAFAESWKDISYNIAKHLESSGFDASKAQYRWGGHVLERMFSIYAQSFNPIERPLMFFGQNDPMKPWEQ